jgi:hypothetical protein
MIGKKHGDRARWAVGTAALALVAAPLLGATTQASASAPSTGAGALAAAAEVDEAGTFMIWQGLSVGAGALAGGSWNNTPPGNSYSVDVRPISTTVTTTCQLEVVRTWRAQDWRADNTRELKIFWQVRNVGTVACQGDVYLTWVR